MKGYLAAVQWIADNDESAEMDPGVIAHQTTVLLLADLTGNDPGTVALDVVLKRRGEDPPPAPRKPTTKQKDRAKFILDRLDSFHRLARQNTDEVGAIQLALTCTRAMAMSYIEAAREMRRRGIV